MFENVNLAAVLISALFYFLFSGLWYSLIFGRTFVCSLGLDENEEELRSKKLKKLLPIYFLNGLIISTTISLLLSFFSVQSFFSAIGITLLILFGLLIPLSINCFCLEKRPVKIFLINMGSYLFSLLGITIIIYLWQ